MTTPTWPNNARAAIAVTIDNMGEAADLNRNLWPSTQPIGSHYSVTKSLPAMLTLLKKYSCAATFFIESWNTNVYGDFILENIVRSEHEFAWHAWQHEAWSTLREEGEERGNFERSFGPEGVGKWVDGGLCEAYRGFRPPGGLINGERTMQMCLEYGLGYISPAADEAAVVECPPNGQSLVVLPFKWATVDAYYYMEAFGKLRKMKGEYSEDPQSPEVLLHRFKQEIDQAIETGGFRAILFHPFLTDREERFQVMEEVLQYLSEKRDSGEVWSAPCKDIEKYVREHPGIVGKDPIWDTSSWR